MDKSNHRVIFVAALTAMAALLLVLVAPESTLPGSRVTSDSIGPHGKVTVSVLRDGQEIYYHEGHNLITNAGKDFIAQQIGGSSGLATNGANYIALSSNTDAPAAGDTTLAGEITTGGLARSQGDYAHTNGQNTFTVTETFTASATHSNIQKAGLFTASSGGTMVAENTFSSVTLADGDQLTITWTITLT
jgi:hypothetical protein